MTFRPMKPETLIHRALARHAARLAELPGKIAAREAMAAKSSDLDDRKHWLASAEALREELTRYQRTAENFRA